MGRGNSSGENHHSRLKARLFSTSFSHLDTCLLVMNEKGSHDDIFLKRIMRYSSSGSSFSMAARTRL